MWQLVVHEGPNVVDHVGPTDTNYIWWSMRDPTWYVDHAGPTDTNFVWWSMEGPNVVDHAGPTDTNFIWWSMRDPTWWAMRVPLTLITYGGP